MTAADYFAHCGLTGQPLRRALVIDAHAHIGHCVGIPIIDTRLKTLISVMDRLGIARVYASAFDAVFGLDRMGNDRVIAAARQYPDRIRGYMALNPAYRTTLLPEMKRCFKAGLRAIKIWSYGMRPGLRYDHPNYDLIFRFAHDRRLPILAHTWAGQEIEQLRDAFERYNGIRWILAHAGSGDTEKYMRTVTVYPHVYLDPVLSSCPRGFLERLVARVPIGKIVWGTDQLLLNPAHQLGRVLFARLTQEQKRAILGENAARLLE